MRALNQNLVELVKLLNDGQYHDGTSIGHALDISRAAIWKAIKKLEQYDVPLTSTKGRGYQLNAPLLLLDKKEIQAKLKHKSVNVEILEKTASTNDYLKVISDGNQAIYVCLAEMQTAGKGRLQRHWHSPFAENIYLSLLCPFEKDISELRGLSLVVGLALCHAIESIISLKNEKIQIKWPNDLLLHGMKLAGTLIEIQAESNGFCQATIGVGINVNMSKVDGEAVAQNWISLYKAVDKYIDRNQLVPKIIDTIIDYLEIFSTKGFQAFKSEWLKRDCLINTNVELTSRGKVIKGNYAGIDDFGHVCLKLKSGKLQTFACGHASILKKPIKD